MQVEGINKIEHIDWKQIEEKAYVTRDRKLHDFRIRMFYKNVLLCV